MKNNTAFSVLMSTYYKDNSEYIEKALKSVLNQTVMPQQIVLVEDGKIPKDIQKVIRKFKKEYPNIIEVIKRNENKGLGISLAEGLLQCKNEIIARMDTDDISEPNRFEEELKIFDDPNIDIVGSNTIEYNEEMTEIISYKKVAENDKEIKKYLKRRNPFNHMTVMFRKNAVLDVGNYEDVPFFEDYYLWCKILKTGKGYNIQKDLVKVRGGKSLYKRRGGYKYIKSIVKFEFKIYKLKTINMFEMISNIIIRTVIALMPSKIRKDIYIRKLRK